MELTLGFKRDEVEVEYCHLGGTNSEVFARSQCFLHEFA